MDFQVKTITKVALIALLWIGIINTGLVNADAQLRLVMAHSWWTGIPEISLASNYKPQYRVDVESLIAGVAGTHGKRYIPYDPGQSLLMLPADWLGTQIGPLFPKTGEKGVRTLTINFLTFVPLSVAAVVACYWLLRLFDFEEKIAGLASITWLLGTTVLPYAQVPQQNNQVLLCVTLGYAAALALIRYNSPRWAFLGGLALGWAFLIRLTSFIHIFTVFLFFIGCLFYQKYRIQQILRLGVWWVLGLLPPILLGRWLDHVRYGSFFVTGQTLLVQQWKTDPIYTGLPGLPEGFPFTTPPLDGILSILFSPAKSIFIYDPLLIPCLVLGVVLWRRFSPLLKWYLITAVLNLVIHIFFYSRLYFWHGDASWAARYHVTSVHLLLIPLVGCLIKDLWAARGFQRWMWTGIIALAVTVQIASVTMVYSLESAQGELLPETVRYQQFRLGQRFENIACQMDAYRTHSSFAEKCLERTPEQLPKFQQSFLSAAHQMAFVPFNSARFGFNRRWSFLIWGALVAVTLIATILFIYDLSGISLKS